MMKFAVDNKDTILTNSQTDTISIIIPVYNAEKTIIKCLKSIAETNYEQYEIIVVDDGSSDNSVNLIEEYMDINNHVRLIGQTNSGPSAARNRGLQLAHGNIITFVDSDDFVVTGYLDYISNKFTNENIDVLFFAFHRVTSEGNILSTHMLPPLQEEYVQNLINLSENDVFGYTWIKAFRKNLAGKIQFKDNINLFEDEIFTCQLLQNPVKIGFFNEPLYCYVRTEGTLVDRTHQDYCTICNMVWNEWRKLLKDNPCGMDFLISKANHMAKVCKWYAFERKIKVFSFYKEMANSDFIHVVTEKDFFIEKIKNKKWFYIIIILNYSWNNI